MNENVPLKITDTTLRDAHQSLWATRMRTEDILPIASKIDEVGYHSVEVWGGATFDVALRYLEEDPWDRLKKMKQHFKKTPLQMLLRGQNLVGYKNYPDDLLEAFIKKAAEGGINIFRVFDALNDIRNVEKSINVIKKEGAEAQGSICYARSPVHTIDSYLKFSKQLIDAGVDSLNIKDMSGILTPFDAYTLVKSIKSSSNIPIQLHCHSSSGMATASYVKACEAGVDIIDCAAAPLALYTSQPAVETLVAIFRGTPRETTINFDKVHRISEYWEGIALKRQLMRTNQSLIDVSVIEHQIPGGMVSNLIVQLEQQNALARIEEVLQEVPEVRKDMGWPPLVTPISQIVGTQAVFNVLSGKRYKIVPREVKNYLRGQYGRPPSKINQKIKNALIPNEKTIDCRPADLLEPALEKAKHELTEKNIQYTEEDVITYALFPEVAIEFFKNREKNKNKKKEDFPVASESDNVSFVSNILGKLQNTSISIFTCESGGRKVSIKKSSSPPTKPVKTKENEKNEIKPSLVEKKITKKEENGSLKNILSVMVGVFSFGEYRGNIDIGSIIEKDQPVGVIRSMHIDNEIKSDFKCKIIEKLVDDQEPVEYGQPLYAVELL